MSQFKVDDRVRISGNAPVLKNLAGREGVVVEILPGSEMRGPQMFSVTIDNLVSVPTVPFYASELIKIDKNDLELIGEEPETADKIWPFTATSEEFIATTFEE